MFVSFVYYFSDILVFFWVVWDVFRIDIGGVDVVERLLWGE